MPDSPTPAEASPRSHASDSDGVLPVVLGTGGWAIALIVLLILRPRLEESGAGWWIGVAVVGMITGVLATAYLARRRGRLRQRAD